MAGPGVVKTLRYVRGGFLTAASTALALAGHALGGGLSPARLPPLWAVLLTGVLVGGLSVGAAGRTLSFWKILIVLGWAQLAFHLVFTVAASGPSHHMAAAPAPAAGSGPAMTAAHALAAVTAAGLMAGAERALWWLLGAVFAIVALGWPLLRPGPVDRPPWRPARTRAVTPRPGTVLARAVRRRGPPTARPHAVT
ncbi:hypothetical protein [Actinomadura rugatobispora]|uniref:MFS transporter n=1 Tax=Actinomadura rugatobispora TaxID=1994 RepID=A0ABW0ZVG4_9ACTN|nr:hypothetical protein GCM10010200_001390 [Actinomadura rugatobispora]